MNDRYLFRAKRTDNGEWVEGFLVETRHNTYHDGYRIIDKNGINYDELDYYEPSFISYVIDKTTICQCTGLKDKNGKLIWENDVVKKEFYTDYDAFANSEEYIGVVKYEDCAWCVSYKRDGYKCSSPIFMAMEYHDAEHFEVIGNIFDEGSDNIGK